MVYFFFFKQKTAYEMVMSDWSSDVCSSDLPRRKPRRANRRPAPGGLQIAARQGQRSQARGAARGPARGRHDRKTEIESVVPITRVGDGPCAAFSAARAPR